MTARRAEGLDPRVSWTAGAVVAVCLGTVLLGMEPRLVLVGLLVVAVAAAGICVVDLGDSTGAVVWQAPGTTGERAATVDRRVRLLRNRLQSRGRRRSPLARSDDDVEADDDIAVTLLAAIDDQLRSEHGIDRAASPEAAATVLGPELTRFVSDPAARRSMTSRRGLASTLQLIEAL